MNANCRELQTDLAILRLSRKTYNQNVIEGDANRVDVSESYLYGLVSKCVFLAEEKNITTS